MAVLRGLLRSRFGFAVAPLSELVEFKVLKDLLVVSVVLMFDICRPDAYADGYGRDGVGRWLLRTGLAVDSTLLSFS